MDTCKPALIYDPVLIQQWQGLNLYVPNCLLSQLKAKLVEDHKLIASLQAVLTGWI